MLSFHERAHLRNFVALLFFFGGERDSIRYFLSFIILPKPPFRPQSQPLLFSPCAPPPPPERSKVPREGCHPCLRRISNPRPATNTIAPPPISNRMHPAISSAAPSGASSGPGGCHVRRRRVTFAPPECAKSNPLLFRLSSPPRGCVTAGGADTA